MDVFGPDPTKQRELEKLLRQLEGGDTSCKEQFEGLSSELLKYSQEQLSNGDQTLSPDSKAALRKDFVPTYDTILQGYSALSRHGMAPKVDADSSAALQNSGQPDALSARACAVRGYHSEYLMRTAGSEHERANMVDAVQHFQMADALDSHLGQSRMVAGKVNEWEHTADDLARSGKTPDKLTAIGEGYISASARCPNPVSQKIMEMQGGVYRGVAALHEGVEPRHINTAGFDEIHISVRDLAAKKVMGLVKDPEQRLKMGEAMKLGWDAKQGMSKYRMEGGEVNKNWGLHLVARNPEVASAFGLDNLAQCAPVISSAAPVSVGGFAAKTLPTALAATLAICVANPNGPVKGAQLATAPVAPAAISQSAVPAAVSPFATIMPASQAFRSKQVLDLGTTPNINAVSSVATVPVAPVTPAAAKAATHAVIGQSQNLTSDALGQESETALGSDAYARERMSRQMEHLNGLVGQMADRAKEGISGATSGHGLI